MKGRATAAVAAPRGVAGPTLSDYLELTKPRITALVLVTAAAGFYLASPGPLNLALFAHTLLGVGLVAAGTSGMNQVLERDTDALMTRTRRRPLPTGRVPVTGAAIFSGGLAASGIIYLTFFTNLVTGILALATFVSYDFLYTPLKRVHSLSTVVGAVPGALPILGGWTAATGALGSGGWSLFIILFLWQLPHFLTLSWVLREDYQRAGIRMLSVEDPDGLRTRHQTLVYTLALVPASLLPSVIGIAGALYFAMALPLGIGFIWLTAGFCRAPESARARGVFRYSIFYLPVLLIALAIDKV